MKRLLVALVCAIALIGCATLKPVVRTIDDIAHDACALFFSEHKSLSFEDAAKAFCATEEQIRPFLDQIKRAQRVAGERALHAPPPYDGGVEQ